MCQWNEVKSQFETDGSLRDIYVFGIDELMWGKLLTEVALSKYHFEFSHGGNLVQMQSGKVAVSLITQTVTLR